MNKDYSLYGIFYDPSSMVQLSSLGSDEEAN